MTEILSSLDFTTTGMLPQIRILEGRNLLTQDGKKYVLTEIGHVITKQLSPLVKTVDVIEKHESFWKGHDIGSIPSQLMMKIYQLGNYQIIESSIEEIYEPHKEFIENILKSKKLLGISPIVHPIYPDFFLQLAEKGIEVSLIFTKKAFNKVEKEYHDKLARGLSLQNVTLYISDDDIKFACVSTDRFFSVSFFLKNGVFDSRNDVVSFDESALLWGEELFNYFSERSRRIQSLYNLFLY
jgi:predicted transcriptional regulator